VNRSKERRRGRADQRVRAQLQVQVDAGTAKCWRCGEPIEQGSTDWDAGHVVSLGEGGHPDGERRPEHRRDCNRSAGGKLAAELKRGRRVDRRRFL
jgi:hypothetical protein